MFNSVKEAKMELMLMLSYMAHLSNKKTQEGQITVVRLMDGWMKFVFVWIFIQEAGGCVGSLISDWSSSSRCLAGWLLKRIEVFVTFRGYFRCRALLAAHRYSPRCSPPETCTVSRPSFLLSPLRSPDRVKFSLYEGSIFTVP